MTIQRLDSNQRMSRILIHNNLVYLCGQVSEEGFEDIRQQTRSMLARVDALLERAGSSRRNLLSATLYLANMGDYDAMNEVWDDWLEPGCAPVRTCVEARLAGPELRVEVTVIAALEVAPTA